MSANDVTISMTAEWELLQRGLTQTRYMDSLADARVLVPGAPAWTGAWYEARPLSDAERRAVRAWRAAR